MIDSYVLDLRHDDVGGAVTSGHLYRAEGNAIVDWDSRLPEFRAATSGKRLLVLVHGYNVSRREGQQSLIPFSRLVAAAADAMLAVLWPGDGWAKALTYPFEGKDADDSADALSRWLSINAADDARIAFVGHSLGCRVVMNAAQRLAQASRRQVDRICLMAPAIDDDSLGRSGKTCYRDGTLGADRVAVLASEEDQVLRFAYPLGDLLQTILYGERWGRALGRTGPIEKEPPIVRQIEPVPKADPTRDIGHGSYLEIDPPNGAHTIAESETFVLQFLDRVPKPYWPAQR